MAKFNVIDIDRGWNGIVKELKLMENKPFVKVGFQTNTASKKKNDNPETTVLEVAIKNEFGSGRIPERSFIRSTHDEKNRGWTEDLKKLVNGIYGRFVGTEKALNIIGLKATNDIKEKILKGDPKWKPNSPITIAKKGSSKPLIDTGQMLNSIRHKVVMRGE